MRQDVIAVCVDLAGRLGDEVTAYVESEAAWHAVERNGPVPPLFTLTPAPTTGPCAVVREGPVPAQEVRELLLAGALDVVVWPDERARLLEIPARIAAPPLAGRPVPVLRVGAARGGVGASTVALVAGALVAWRGGRALVVGSDAMLRLAGVDAWQGAGATELHALGSQAADEVAGLARPIRAVKGLEVLGGAPAPVVPVGWPYDVVVLDDAGAAAPLVVAAADGCLHDVPPNAQVLVVEHGPLDRAGVRRVLGRSPAGWLPYSARVARAGLAGRVPSSLPGSWVAAARSALARAAGAGRADVPAASPQRGAEF